MCGVYMIECYRDRQTDRQKDRQTQTAQKQYTTGTANSLLAKTEWPRELATIKRASETTVLCLAVTDCRVFSNICTVVPSIVL